MNDTTGYLNTLGNKLHHTVRRAYSRRTSIARSVFDVADMDALREVGLFCDIRRHIFETGNPEIPPFTQLNDITSTFPNVAKLPGFRLIQGALDGAGYLSVMLAVYPQGVLWLDDEDSTDDFYALSDKIDWDGHTQGRDSLAKRFLHTLKLNFLGGIRVVDSPDQITGASAEETAVYFDATSNGASFQSPYLIWSSWTGALIRVDERLRSGKIRWDLTFLGVFGKKVVIR